MAKPLERQGYRFFACERCGFAYKDAAMADKCSLHDLEHGMRSMDITKESIAPPDRYYQAVLKFMEEEAKAAKAKAAGAAKAAAAPAAPPAAGAGAPAGSPGAAPAPAGAKPAPSPEELEARKKAALEKAAAAKAAKQQA